MTRGRELCLEALPRPLREQKDDDDDDDAKKRRN